MFPLGHRSGTKARGATSKLSPGFANEKKVDHFSLIVEVSFNQINAYNLSNPCRCTPGVMSSSNNESQVAPLSITKAD